ncbi:hypothetical protein H6F86_05990 [Phormidium sp. FACHB-592]|uniref:Uncharacterized protein n=1 Tax=Stenomitos frigidus AS-A4 TaxID=2933935 RepID=A0ABV0KRC8_9CYAN|nr:hypothetical protein [Phormidium sp. FACHB-592]MBD2073443.1 hypothetical protein [Phormidium sp. FACHB-592]
MTNKAEIEQRWIEAWNDLYELAGDRYDVKCLLPDGRVVDLEECKGWLQDAVYEGWRLKVEVGWVRGRRGIIASQWRD